MAEIWPNLTKNEQAYYLNQQAGANQSVNLSAALGNWKKVQDATTTALNSSGSALRENEAAMDSLEKKTNAVKAVFQDFSTNVISKGLVSDALTVLKGALNILNTDVGVIITQVGLATGVIVGLNAIIKMLAGKTAIGALISSLKAGTTAVKMFSAAWKASPLGVIGLAAGVIYGIVKVIDALIVTEDEHLEKLDEINAKYDELTGAGSRYEELKSHVNSLTEAERIELEVLEAQVQALKDKAALEEQAAFDAWNKERTKSKFVGTETGETSAGRYVQQVYASQAEQDLQAFNQSLTEAQELYSGTASSQEMYRKHLQEIISSYSEFYEKAKKYKDLGYELSETDQELYDLYEKTALELSELSEATGAYNDTLSETQEETKTQVEKDKDRLAALKSIVDAQDKATSALNEYKEKGDLSISTLSTLMDLGEEYVDLLYDENGNLNITKDTLTKLVNALNQQYAAESELLGVGNQLVNQATAKQNALLAQAEANGTLSRATYDEIAAETIFNNTKLDTAGKIKALKNLAISAGVSAAAIDAVNAGIEGGSPHGRKDILGIYDEKYSIEKAYEMLMEKATIPPGGGGGGTTTDPELERLKDRVSLLKSELDILEKQDASADEQIAKIKEIQDALHDQAEYMRSIGESQADINALSSSWLDYQEKIEELSGKIKKDFADIQSDYEKVIDYYTEYADRQIDALDKQLDELEDEIDAVNDKYDKQLETLENQNDELDKQIELQKLLDALAKAKATKKMVYRDGQFVYESDIDAISEAQKDIDDFNREQRVQDEKDRIEALRDAELAEINTRKEQLDNAKQFWEDYKEGWNTVVSEYNYLQNKLLADQMYGANQENDTYLKRVDNLQQFIIRYKELMSSLEDESKYATDKTDYAALMLKASSAEEFWELAEKRNLKSAAQGLDISGKNGAWANNEQLYQQWLNKGNTSLAASRTAGGTYSLSGTGISSIGINESSLVSGSSAANRTTSTGLGALTKGLTGVTNKNTNYAFNVDNVTLPNAKSAKDFVDGIKAMAIQKAKARARSRA